MPTFKRPKFNFPGMGHQQQPSSAAAGEGIMKMAFNMANNAIFQEFKVQHFIAFLVALWVMPTFSFWLDTLSSWIPAGAIANLVALVAFHVLLNREFMYPSDAFHAHASLQYATRLSYHLTQIGYHTWFLSTFAHAILRKRADAAGDAPSYGVNFIVTIVAITWTLYAHHMLQMYRLAKEDQSVGNKKRQARNSSRLYYGMWTLVAAETLFVVTGNRATFAFVLLCCALLVVQMLGLSSTRTRHIGWICFPVAAHLGIQLLLLYSTRAQHLLSHAYFYHALVPMETCAACLQPTIVHSSLPLSAIVVLLFNSVLRDRLWVVVASAKDGKHKKQALLDKEKEKLMIQKDSSLVTALQNTIIALLPLVFYYSHSTFFYATLQLVLLYAAASEYMLRLDFATVSSSVGGMFSNAAGGVRG